MRHILLLLIFVPSVAFAYTEEEIASAMRWKYDAGVATQGGKVLEWDRDDPLPDEDQIEKDVEDYLKEKEIEDEAREARIEALMLKLEGLGLTKDDIELLRELLR